MPGAVGPLLSPKPQVNEIPGAVYNNTPPQPVSGQGVALQADSEGNLLVTIASEAPPNPPGVPETPTAVAVGTGSTSVLPANAFRTGLVLINTSSNWISLSFGSNAAVLYSGISLAPSGGVFEMDNTLFTTESVQAIASGASSNLAVQEYES